MNQTECATKMFSRRARHGFTLVEVLVAGTIFLVSLAGVMTGMKYSSQRFEHHRNMTSALAVSETVMEEVLMLAQTDPELAPGPHSRRYNALGMLDPTGQFTAAWNVTLDVPVVGVREIILRVQWAGSNGLEEMMLRSVRS